MRFGILLLIFILSSCKTIIHRDVLNGVGRDSIMLTGLVSRVDGEFKLVVDQVYIPSESIMQLTESRLLAEWMHTSDDSVFYKIFLKSKIIAEPHFLYTALNLNTESIQVLGSSDPSYVQYLKTGDYSSERVLLMGINSNPKSDSVLRPTMVAPFSKDSEKALLKTHVPSSYYKLNVYSEYKT